MFSDIGKKIKKLAKIMCVVGWLGSFILGIFASDWWLGLDFGGFLIFGVGSAVIVYISNMILYAFGQLVDDVHKEKPDEQTSD